MSNIYSKLSSIDVYRSLDGYINFVDPIAWGATCPVCNWWYSTEASDITLEGIHESHTIQFNDAYYLITADHKKCREIFALNPLAYE